MPSDWTRWSEKLVQVVALELDSLEEVAERTLNKMLSIMASCDHPLHIVFCKRKNVFSGRLLLQRKSFVPRTEAL